ncbi:MULTISPECIES: GNAT family N-acetyltransferase [Sphingobacterium]|uniref:GNAT family N-acetyltransferase n=1 Tax=Sphingobacterium litopenaei TaxID=2763500 RepID=A0ABR7Y9R2_9SPHI|nr:MULTISPECIES: GNAT family N-acetyltransferase [Sphingobacterium]MBD1428048.1 GNAT family N-acetyltransferase [Sphingobacterium litopenaei]NGM72036.1 GNAT family N-acetyltransferase [Sphingobacterium sp. SGL-16]
MSTTWIVREFADLTSLELYKILQLRINVFMLEQECLYPECDNKDLKGKHLMGIINDEVVAYARLLPPNVSYTDASIGRVVVNPNARHLKLGTELMRQAISAMRKYFPYEAIRISAQAHLQAFYENVGFVRVSEEPYLEDNIPHVEMVLA